MAKRSTNLNRGHTHRTRASDILNLANWLGMSEAEQHVVFGRAPLFVNLNGEETVPARLYGGRVYWTVNTQTFGAAYISTDIHPVSDGDGLTWYEINDTALHGTFCIEA